MEMLGSWDPGAFSVERQHFIMEMVSRWTNLCFDDGPASVMGFGFPQERM